MAETPAKELEAAVRQALECEQGPDIGGICGGCAEVLQAALARWEAPGGEREGWEDLFSSAYKVDGYLEGQEIGAKMIRNDSLGEGAAWIRKPLAAALARLRGAK